MRRILYGKIFERTDKMNGKLFSVCHKRIATVCITQIDNSGKHVNRGLCLVCAKKMKLPQVTQFLDKMGISDEDLETMTDGMEALIDNMNQDGSGDDPEGSGEDGALIGNAEEKPSGTNTPNLFKLFGSMGGSLQPPDEFFGGRQNLPEEQLRNNGKSGQQKKEKPQYKFLSLYSVDLTERAALGGIDNIVGREREIERIIQILNRRTKNNPVLIGEAGVGKTAIAEGLALRISRGEAPEKLLDKRIHLLDLTAMVAGTQFRGQFEGRMKGLIDEVKKAGNIILVIDEVHNIMGAGEAEGSMNAANILKPALSRGEIQVIGATTLKEYRKFIEKDSALERRFQPVFVNEPSVQETIDILKGIKVHYEVYHKVRMSDAVIEDAVKMSERYITDRFLPDKAIDVIDEAASRANLRNKTLPLIAAKKKEVAAQNEKITELEAREYKTDEERMEAFKEIAEAKSTLALQQSQLAELEQKQYIDLTYEDVAKVIETWTGIPLQRVSEDEARKLLLLEDRLKEHVIGQDEAISTLSKAIRRNRSGFRNHFKPASFIFVGPTGVGKTELVKQLTIELFGTEDALIRLDMSEYMEKHTVSKMIGSPPGYIGYDEAGQLTERVRRRPYSVILFDEIEKAHPDVFNMLLQILDDGRLTDSQGRTVNFENTVIIMTSNAGNSIRANRIGFSADGREDAEEHAKDALKAIFRPEFLNRVDEIIVFNSLSGEDLQKIAKIMMQEIFSECRDKGITLEVSDAVYHYLAENGYNEKYGARPLRHLIQKKIEDELSELFLMGKLREGSRVKAELDDKGEVVLQCSL